MAKSKAINDSRKAKAAQVGVVAIAAFVLLGVAVFTYLNNPQTKLAEAAADRGDRTAQKYDTAAKVVDPKEAYIAKSSADILEIKKELEAQKKVSDDLRKQIELNKTIAASSNNSRKKAISLLPPVPSREDPDSPFKTTNLKAAKLPAQTMTPPQTGPLASIRGPLLEEDPEVEKVTFKKKKGKDAKLHMRDTIPANSFFRSVLLSGVDAPTGGLAKSNPHPVLMEFVGNGNLPNNFRHKAKSCRVSGEAYGNLSDERTYARLNRLTCVLRTGEIISESVKGYIAGPDGKNGVRGTLVEKQGALIGRALLAGMFGSIGSAVSQTYTNLSTSPTGSVQSIDPGKTLEYGLGAGVGNAFEKVSDWYLKRADEIYPVIETPPGIVVDVVFTEDVKLGANLLEENQ